MPLPPGLLLLLLSGATATAALPLEGSPTGPDSEVSTVPTWPHASPLSVSCWLFGLHGECVCARMLQFTAWTGHRAELCSDLGWLEVLGCYIQLILSYMSQPMKPAGNLCSSRRTLHARAPSVGCLGKGKRVYRSTAGQAWSCDSPSRAFSYTQHRLPLAQSNWHHYIFHCENL